VRDMVENFEINVPFVPTKENVADFFTKSLPAPAFFAFRKRLLRRPFGRPPPRATERVRLPRRRAREFADATKPASRFPESDAGRATRVRRALPPPPLCPPRGPNPPPDSRRTGCSVERDPRHAKGRDARAAPQFQTSVGKSDYLSSSE